MSLVRKRRFLDDSVTRVARTDERGLFRFDTLTAMASYTVKVQKPGFLQQWHAILTTPGVRDSLCVALYEPLLGHMLTPVTTNQDSTNAGAQGAPDRRYRAMVIPTLLCGSKHQWDAATYLDQRVWAGLDTTRLRRISPELFKHNDFGAISDACEAWVYHHDSLRTYSAGDALALGGLYHARALLFVRTLAGVNGVVADVGVYVRSQPPVSEHFSSSPHATAERALDELLPRIRVLLTRSRVLPSP